MLQTPRQSTPALSPRAEPLGPVDVKHLAERHSGKTRSSRVPGSRLLLRPESSSGRGVRQLTTGNTPGDSNQVTTVPGEGRTEHRWHLRGGPAASSFPAASAGRTPGAGKSDSPHTAQPPGVLQPRSPAGPAWADKATACPIHPGERTCPCSPQEPWEPALPAPRSQHVGLSPVHPQGAPSLAPGEPPGGPQHDGGDSPSYLRA